MSRNNLSGRRVRKRVSVSRKLSLETKPPIPCKVQPANNADLQHWLRFSFPSLHWHEEKHMISILQDPATTRPERLVSNSQLAGYTYSEVDTQTWISLDTQLFDLDYVSVIKIRHQVISNVNTILPSHFHEDSQTLHCSWARKYVHSTKFSSVCLADEPRSQNVTIMICVRARSQSSSSNFHIIWKLTCMLSLLASSQSSGNHEPSTLKCLKNHDSELSFNTVYCTVACMLIVALQVDHRPRAFPVVLGSRVVSSLLTEQNDSSQPRSEEPIKLLDRLQGLQRLAINCH